MFSLDSASALSCATAADHVPRETKGHFLPLTSPPDRPHSKLNECESPSTWVRRTHIPGEVEDLGDEGDVLKAHETGVLPQTKPVGQRTREVNEMRQELRTLKMRLEGAHVDNGLLKDPNGPPFSALAVSSNAQHRLAAKESHKAQRVLQDQRKAARPHSQLIANAKRVWSLARQKYISSTERRKHVQDLLDIVTGKVKDIVLKHDASRIIQTIVKYGGQKERDQVAGELKGHYRELAQSKYFKFLVTKLIRFCPAHRASILLEFQSHVLKLLLHREASNKSPAMKALTGALASPYPSEDPARPHPIDLPHTSRLYKTLLQGGHFSHSERSVARSSAFSPSEFASVFLSIVGGDTTIAIAQGDGAFVVAQLLERIRQEGSDAQKTQVRGWFDDSFVARMKDSEGKGKNVLVEKIKALLGIHCSDKEAIAQSDTYRDHRLWNSLSGSPTASHGWALGHWDHESVMGIYTGSGARRRHLASDHLILQEKFPLKTEAEELPDTRPINRFVPGPFCTEIPTQYWTVVSVRAACTQLPRRRSILIPREK
ncbi:hypothetical protein L210DRAFT_3633624 [Boletus edulis BED1]|uniref:CPL domain-containing protein n=1 Tax=Boletus edulis BED1 TaxID=1328754 RepID=A0AAD4BI07_BOLED|nr:hypothetical protein L210DRAFT_3633624 [Boletus edulis BED1]